MRQFTRWMFTTLLVLLGAAAVGQAEAQDYPTRPVRLVVPYPAGGPTDAIARILAQKLGEKNRAQFYVENVAVRAQRSGLGAWRMHSRTATPC